MKIQERTGKWIEVEKSRDRKGEVVISVPNSIWAGWQAPVFLKEDELAEALRSLGWQVSLPGQAVVVPAQPAVPAHP